jgi:hypothetical protein
LKFKSTRMDGVFGIRVDRQAKSLAMPPVPQESNVKEEDVRMSPTWAEKAGALGNVAMQNQSPIIKAKALPPGAILVNAEDQRVDAALAQPTPNGTNGWIRKTKTLRQKYCRAYHLQGACGMSDCMYNHGSLTEEERLVYRLHLRGKPCNAGSACRDPRCVYGHTCPCKQNGCAFRAEMHGVDTSTAQVWRTV